MTSREMTSRIEAWAAAGLITGEQAEAIRAHEATTAERELPRWVEPVAYLGVTLVGLALLLFGVQVWDQLAAWGRVALAAVVTAVLLGAGVGLRHSDAPAARRAGSFAWLLAVAGVAATLALTLFSLLDLTDDLALMLTALGTLLAAGALYLTARTAAQHLALAAGVVFVVVSGATLLPLEPAPWTIGFAFFAIGVVWMLLTWGGLLPPEKLGWLVGGLLTLALGIGTADADAALWSGLGVAVGLVLVYLSTVVDQRVLLVVGVLGLVVWIPTTVTVLFEGSIVVPVAILLTGVVTLAVVVAAARARAPEPPGPAQPEEPADA